MNLQFQPSVLGGAIAFALYIAPLSSHAAANIVQASLNPLVVTATRSEESTDKIPARIHVIEPKVVEQSPIAQFADLLRSEATINVVQLGGYGQQTSIFMRGTDSDHTLVLRDGVRLNNDASGLATLNFLDTTDIKQIEVLKGPASVLYGTNAIGGVIQIISQTPERTGAFVTAEVGEHNTYKALIGADLAEDGFFAQVRGQRLESDGTLITDHADAIKSNFDQKGFSAKAGLAYEDYGVSLDYTENTGTSVYQGFDWATADYRNKAQAFENQITTLKAYHQLNSALRANLRVSRFEDYLEQLHSFEITQYQSDEYELMLKQALAERHQVTVGATHKALSTETLKTQDAFAEDLDTTGYYIQHQYQSDRLNTQVGYRLEEHQKYGSHHVGQAGVRYQVQPNLSVYSNVGTAFKAPTVNNLYYGSSANPNLMPEESTSYEVGFDHTLSQNWMIGGSIYHTDIENLIDYASVAPWGLENLSEARLQGIEASARWKHQAYYFNTHYHYVKAMNAQTDTELLRRPRQTLALTAGMDKDNYGLSATLVAKSKAKDWDTRKPTAGYATLDLHGYWNVNPHVKVFGNIQNVADTQYKAAYDGSLDGVYYINGGRLASVGLSFKY